MTSYKQNKSPAAKAEASKTSFLSQPTRPFSVQAEKPAHQTKSEQLRGVELRNSNNMDFFGQQPVAGNSAATISSQYHYNPGDSIGKAGLYRGIAPAQLMRSTEYDLSTLLNQSVDQSLHDELNRIISQYQLNPTPMVEGLEVALRSDLPPTHAGETSGGTEFDQDGNLIRRTNPRIHLPIDLARSAISENLNPADHATLIRAIQHEVEHAKQRDQFEYMGAVNEGEDMSDWHRNLREFYAHAATLLNRSDLPALQGTAKRLAIREAINSFHAMVAAVKMSNGSLNITEEQERMFTRIRDLESENQ